jgi:hypothetical protein
VVAWVITVSQTEKQMTDFERSRALVCFWSYKCGPGKNFSWHFFSHHGNRISSLVLLVCKHIGICSALGLTIAAGLSSVVNFTPRLILIALLFSLDP